MNLPKPVEYVLESLNAGGFKAYIVGGAVRDALLCRDSFDYDVCTDARPDEVRRVFSAHKTAGIGERFGTVSVVMGKENIEITTFRSDKGYSDSRHPDTVVFSDSLAEDLGRRDFTMNAVAYHPKEGYIDHFGGIADIESRIIRTVGDPRDRFGEDSLRILRALRFSATLKFHIEPRTAEAIIEYRKTVASLSPERIRDELSKFIVAENAGEELLKYKYNWLVVIPELRDCDRLHHYSPYHNLNVLAHIAKTVDNVKPTLTLRLAALLHDIAKPHVTGSGRDKFPGHMERSAEMARNILMRLCYPKKLIDDISLLIRHHDYSADRSVASAKRALNLIGERLIFDFIEHKRADASARHPDLVGDRLLLLDAFQKNVEAVLKSGACYRIDQLAVNGNDILALGFSGEAVGAILQFLLVEVMEGRAGNDRDTLFLLAAGMFKNRNDGV